MENNLLPRRLIFDPGAALDFLLGCFFVGVFFVAIGLKMRGLNEKLVEA
ncbi:hypothetical protein WCN91_00295 [Pseudoalteromonas sp. YIC-827]|uniref:Uncharacterized protein n=1 Tax=Pseudoalteromonas qingdaonensis TaxID=3131913 RepID=A0ABU9MUA1_9GAMM